MYPRRWGWGMRGMRGMGLWVLDDMIGYLEILIP
jgi:hypothetical protein